MAVILARYADNIITRTVSLTYYYINIATNGHSFTVLGTGAKYQDSPLPGTSDVRFVSYTLQKLGHYFHVTKKRWRLST